MIKFAPPLFVWSAEMMLNVVVESEPMIKLGIPLVITPLFKLRMFVPIQSVEG